MAIEARAGRRPRSGRALVDRIGHDLARPSVAVGRDELPFVAGGSAIVVVAAQLSDPGSATSLAALVVAACAVVAIVVVPRAPVELVAAVVACAAGAAAAGGALELGLFLLPLSTLYATWHLGSTVRAVGVVAFAVAALLATAAIADGEIAVWPWLAAEGFTFALGRLLRRQRELIGELERARDELADLAVAEERRRIARELHDLTGHTLAAMMLHVTGARHVLRRDVDEAERALADAEAVGRDSMDRIRATVTSLRTTEGGADAPVADLDALDDLVGEYRRAGLRVEASIAPSATLAASGPVGVALHRIAREALANVARHAPSNRVEVSVAADAGRVTIEVADHGRRPATDGARRARYGVVGMQERARALGGRCTAGPTDDGWRVVAELPLGAGAAGAP